MGHQRSVEGRLQRFFFSWNFVLIAINVLTLYFYLGKRTEVYDLLDEMEEKSDKIQRSETMRANLLSNLDQKQDEVNELGLKIGSLTKEKEGLNSEISDRNEIISDRNIQIDNLRKEKISMESSLKDIKNNSLKCETLEEEKKKLIMGHSDEITKLKAANEETKSSLSAAKEELEKCKSKKV